MELYQLRTFIAIAREGNLSRASQKLFTSQPAISAQLKALEEELGVRLFERTSRGMRLTPAGTTLMADADRALAAAHGVLHHARQLQGRTRGELRLGTVSDPISMRIGAFLARMAAAHPEIVLRLSQGISGRVLGGIRDGTLDAGYVVGDIESEDLETVRLRRLRMVVAAPAPWRRRLEGQPWEKVAALPWIGTPALCSFHDLANALGRRLGALPHVVAEADQEHTLRSLIAAGVGVSLLREDQAQAAAQAGEAWIWPDGWQETWLSFVLLRARANDPLLTAALPVVRDVWAESQS